MQIFTYEFQTAVKAKLFCSWRGHKIPHRWTQTYWAIGHAGNLAKFCPRCGTKVKEQIPQWRKDLDKQLKKKGGEKK